MIFQQRHWTSPGMESALQASISIPSDRLKQALKMAPRLLDVYFSIALHDVNQCMYDVSLYICMPFFIYKKSYKMFDIKL